MVDGIGGTVKRLVWNAVMTRKSPVVVHDAQSFFQVANSLQSAVTVSLLKRKEMNDISDSLHLEKCFSEALPIPGISRFHCMEPGGNSLSCFLYSFQSQMENRPPDVYPYESDNSVSDSPSGETSDYSEDEDPSRKTNVNKHRSKEGKANCDSDSESPSGEVSESDMEEESDDGEDCVEFVRAVPTQSLSTTNIKSHAKGCDVRQGMKGLVVFSGCKLISPE